jgi:predicted nucleotidyltransferase
MGMRKSRLDRNTQAILSEIRAGLSEVYGARLRKVCLYGSYARRQQQEGSDMDILVVLDEVRDVGEELSRMSELGSGLSLAHDVTISFCPVDEWEFFNRQSAFLMNVCREAIPV